MKAAWHWLILISEKIKSYKELMKLVDKTKQIGVRANAETPDDAAQHLSLVQRVLVYSQHMFYGEGSEQPLFQLRKMIVSKTEKERQ
jgi:pyruvate,orthophosphate dikinase